MVVLILYYINAGFRFGTKVLPSPVRLMKSKPDTGSSTSIGTTNKPLMLTRRRFLKQTKQIATIGPSCDTVEMVEKLFLNGADVFRINFSHGDYTEKEKQMAAVRKIEKKYNYPIALLADLQVGISFEIDRVSINCFSEFL